MVTIVDKNVEQSHRNCIFEGVVISLTSKLQTSFFMCEKTDTSNQKPQTVV